VFHNVAGYYMFHKNIQTDLIIMDFAKAFDKVSHRRLLYKLEYYGIQTHTLNWIQAFLSELHDNIEQLITQFLLHIDSLRNYF
jgi:hypothetical protein